MRHRYWSDSEYRAFKAQERRDALAEREAAAAREADRRKERLMATRTTAHGERVEKFPKVDELRHRVGAVRKALAEAFDEAERESGLQARMAQSNRTDTKRFPSLGGES